VPVRYAYPGSFPPRPSLLKAPTASIKLIEFLTCALPRSLPECALPETKQESLSQLIAAKGFM